MRSLHEPECAMMGHLLGLVLVKLGTTGGIFQFRVWTLSER